MVRGGAGSMKRYFPAINWNISHSYYARSLIPFFENLDTEYSYLLSQVIGESEIEWEREKERGSEWDGERSSG
jgi:vacuolar-type H+-ATPase catalytic subunit A/Vma1